MSRQGALRDQALALAGVAQAARLVDQISRTGSYPETQLEPLINSLFEFDADNVEDVYGGIAGLRLGLQTLQTMLSNQELDQARESVRYVFSLLYLERKFAARPDMMSVVRSRLEHTQFKSDHFAGHVNEVCHSVSGIYQDTLSTLKFRIKVTGNAQHLQNERNADIIRALLLAGVRSAFLWRQLGGKRWRLALQRGKLRDLAGELSRDLGVV